MTIEIGYNWPTYEKKWGVRKFTPLEKYGIHLHAGRYAVAVNPWGVSRIIKNEMREPWVPYWFKSEMFYRDTGVRVT